MSDFIKSIVARICAFWALLTFIVTFLIVLIPSFFVTFIPDPKGTGYFISIARLWMHVWLRVIGCSIEIKGRENFEKNKSYIVTCNHNSLLDAPLSSPFIPGANKTIAKESFSKIPIFGWYYSKGSVLINRESKSSKKTSLQQMKEVLNRGTHMCIYPEGTRNRTGHPLKEFYSGAFKLSEDTGKEIMPAVIFNTAKILPPEKIFYLLPGKLAIHFLPPISPSGLEADELKQKVFELMETYFVAHSGAIQKRY